MRVAEIVLLVAGLAVVAGCAQPTRSDTAAANSGATDMSEKLDPCPATPNCVCSDYPDDAHAIPPLTFDGDADSAWAALRRAVEALPRTKIVASEAERLDAETRSALFRFVDDLAFRLDASTGVIHVRSASRVGYSDLGANRKRVETLRQLFAEQLAAES